MSESDANAIRGGGVRGDVLPPVGTVNLDRPPRRPLPAGAGRPPGSCRRDRGPPVRPHWGSGVGAILLAANRLRFTAQPLARQRWQALAIWLAHVAALAL